MEAFANSKDTSNQEYFEMKKQEELYYEQSLESIGAEFMLAPGAKG